MADSYRDNPHAKTTVAAGDDEQAILQEIRERYDYAKQQWDPIFEEGATDIRYICGETWDEEDKKLWAGRPMVSFDQLGQFLNQLVNAIRQNKRAVKVSPEGSGANDRTAELRSNRIRQIEYLSNAQEAYMAAFSGAAERSYGHCRVVSEWEHPRSKKKTLRVKSIPNPDQVVPDPDAQSVAGQDRRYLFFRYPMSREEFKRDYPDAKIGDFSPDAMHGVSPDWGNERNVLVCEYWRRTMEPRKLYEVGPEGASVLAFEGVELDAALAQQPPGTQPVFVRESEVPVVCSYLTNGIELLAKGGKPKKTEWPGKFIPFASCYGKVIYKSTAGVTTKIIQSYIRLARSGQKYYNWLSSKKASIVARQANTPVRAAKGVYDGDALTAIQLSMRQPVSAVLHSAYDEAGRPLPPPDWSPVPVGLSEYEFACETARRDIQSALGRYSSSVGKSDTNVRSGVLQENLDKQSDRGSYHFVDHFDSMVSFVGEILDDALPYYDDTADDITVRKPNDEVVTQRVNDPTDPKSISMQQGIHTVTIGTGPDFDSEREEASAFADLIVQNPLFIQALGPEKTQRMIALAIRLKNVGPLGDAMADIASPKDQTDPEAVQQQAMEMQSRLQQAEQIMQQMHAELQDLKKGNDVKLEIARMDNETKLQIARADEISQAADREVKLAVAELGAKVERLALFLEERARVGAQIHDGEMSTLAHQQALETQEAATAAQETV